MVAMGRLEDIRLSFNQVAQIYDDVRPSYPPALFDTLFEMLPPRPEIVEVGPGTGQATKDLLARGATVQGIEIGPAMAALLRANLPTDCLRIRVGDFEKLDIPPASADAVFSAAAYHWITPAAQTDQPARILREGGVLAVVGLVQVDSPTDHGFFAAATPIWERYGETDTDLPAPTRDRADSAIRAVLEADGRFSEVAIHRYDCDQSYSASDYRKLMISYSDVQMMDDARRVGLLDDMESFVRSDFGGRVTRPLVAVLTTATLSPR